MQIQEIKSKIKKIIEENKELVTILFFATCVFLIIFAIYFRTVYINYESEDYTIFLSNWWETIKTNGIKDALAMSIGNYTEFYKIVLVIGVLITDNALLYIKVSTFIFELVFAFCVLLFCKNIFSKSKKSSILIALVSLLIPTIIMNGSVAGQCDIIFTTMLLFMIYFILREKYRTALLFFGLAFAIKLQAIFLAPLILYLLIHKKIKIRDIFIIPLPYLILGIPALIAGKGILDILLIYAKQTEGYSKWVLYAPNAYQLFDLNLESIPKMWTVITIEITGVIVLGTIVLLRKRYSNNLVLPLSLFFALVIPFFLPKMHERYFFLADILSFIYIISFGIKKVPIHILVVTASFFSYANYLSAVYGPLFGNEVLNLLTLNFLAVFNSIAILAVTINMFLECKRQKVKEKAKEIE